MPHSDLATNDDAGEAHTVVKTRAVICRLRVDADENKNHECDDQRGGEAVLANPVIKGIAKEDFHGGKQGSQEGAYNDIKEAMHAAVKAAKHNRGSIEVKCGLHGRVSSGVGRLSTRMQHVNGIHGDGDGIGRVGGGETVLQGRGTGHGNAVQRRGERARKAEHILDEATPENT